MDTKQIFHIPNFIFGLFITLLGALLVGEYIKRVIRSQDLIPPKGIDEKTWRNAFNIPEKSRRSLYVLGFFDSIFFYIAFGLDRPELIAGWLTFKLASKWQTWSTIIKLPEMIDGINTLDEKIEYVGAKNKMGTYTLHRWLIGTMGNILSGFIGMGSALMYPKICPVVKSFLEFLCCIYCC